MERVRARVLILGLLLAAIAAAPAQAAFPGANGLLAYFQDDIGAVAPHGISILGGSPAEIGPTCQEGEDAPCPLNPTWSRAGDRLAFALGGDIAVIDPNGANYRRFDVPGVRAARPAWAPDGARIVFEGLPGGAKKRQLYTMAAAGGDVRKLTSRGGRQPAWSLDGRIAFVRKKDLYLVYPDAKGLRRLTFKGGGQPNWSPHSRQIAFTRKDYLWRLNLAAKSARRLGRGFEPAWTPDGKGILYVDTDGFNYEIYRVRPSGRGAKLVTSGDEGRRLAVIDPDQQPR